jgi:predicted phage terminase large subunit-like protein
VSLTAELLYRTKRQAQREMATQACVSGSTTGTFRDFIRAVAPTFEFYRHVDVLLDALQAVADGGLTRLVIMLPPRHTKSLLASRLFPAYYLRRHPTRWVGLASYGAELAEGFSREARAYYQANGGTLDASSRATNRWNTTAAGGMWAVGVGGGATGRGYSLGIVDDPVKDAQEADSPTYRQRAQDWWDSVFSTRAEPGAAQVVIQTRWHLDDLTGFLLEREANTERPEEWTVIDLPAIAGEPPLALPSSCKVVPDWRQPGEPLCPERFPLERLEQIKASSASRWWQALYQQRPTLAAGSIFIREWFRYYNPAELPQAGWVRIIASIDCTFKDGAGSDFVGLTIWGQRAEGLLLLDLLNRRMGFTATVAAIEGAWQRWQFSELVIEDAANGPAVIDVLKRRAAGFSLRAVRPLGGKSARANAAAPQFEQGRILFPQGAPWLADYERQLLSFPAGAHDDLVDSTTQAVNYVAGTGPMRVSTAHYGHAVEAPGPSDPLATSKPARRLAAVPGFR